MAKAAPLPEKPPEKLSARAKSTLERCLKGLDDHCAYVIGELEQTHSMDVATHLSVTAQKVGQMMGECRKLENDEVAVAAALSPASVMSYLRQLTPEKRGQVIRDLEAMQEGRSVLA